MAQSRQGSGQLELNPFAFPTETDGRFLLLSLVVAAVMYNASFWSLIYVTVPFGVELPEWFQVCFAVGAVLALFGVAHRQAARAAERELQNEPVTTLVKADIHPDERAAFAEMHETLYAMTAAVPLPDDLIPVIMWDNDDVAADGKAIGYAKKQFLILRSGLFTAFVMQRDQFRAIVLHEISHIVNQDVSKVTFSIELTALFNRVLRILIVTIFAVLVFKTVQNIARGDNLPDLLIAALMVVEWTVKLALLSVLVDIIRRSVLRIREHYADNRTITWMGNPDTLVKIIEKDQAREQASDSPGFPGTFWKRFGSFHPALEQRMRYVKRPALLFKPLLETAFLSGILCGLGLNASSSFGASLTDAFFNIALYLADFGMASENLLFTLMILISNFVLTILGFVLTVTVMVFFGIVPLVRTTGNQIQMAAFADSTGHPDAGFLSTRFLLMMSFVLSCGVILGFALTPMIGPVGVGSLFIGSKIFTLIPFYLICWTLLTFVWMLILQKFATRIYKNHKETGAPKKKYSFINRVTGAGLIVMVGAMGITQIYLPPALNLISGPKSMEVPDDLWAIVSIVLIITWSIAMFLSAIIWSIGWFLSKRRGWFDGHSEDINLPDWAMKTERLDLSNL